MIHYLKSKPTRSLKKLLMDAFIGKRLGEFRQRTGRKMSVITAATGIKSDTLYKWEKGTKPSSLRECNALIAYLDKMESITENWLINDQQGLYAHTLPRPAIMRLPLKPNKRAVPANNVKLSPGTITIVNDEPELIVDYLEAPFLGQVEGVVDVVGESMYPSFKSGAKVAVARLQDPTLLIWGDFYYVIDKNLVGLLKRVGPGKTEESIILKSENPDTEKYPPIVRRWDQIEAIFKVKADINRR
jgi:hypothetical protein